MAARGATSALPIAAICCLGIILLAIAATIVLALIPVYLSRKNASCSQYAQQSTSTYTVPISPSQSSGYTLTSSQIAQLNTLLQNSQTTSSTNCAGFTVSGASIGNSGRRKRQLGGFLIVIIFFFASTRAALNRVKRLLIAYLLAQVALINALIQSIFSNSATSAVVSTTPSSSGSTTASGRRRRRNILLRRQAYQAPSELAAANTYKD